MICVITGCNEQLARIDPDIYKEFLFVICDNATCKHAVQRLLVNNR